MQRSSDWLMQALRDLEHARYDLAGGYFEWACFSAEQAAIKACRAVLDSIGSKPQSEGLVPLLEQALASVDDELRRAAEELQGIHCASRFPDAHDSGWPGTLFTAEQAERLIAHAEAIVERCEESCPSLEPS